MELLGFPCAAPGSDLCGVSLCSCFPSVSLVPVKFLCFPLSHNIPLLSSSPGMRLAGISLEATDFLCFLLNSSTFPTLILPPSWLGCLHPHHGPIAGNYFHKGFSSATNFATFTIPGLSPIPPGGSQRQCGAGINPGHGARATSTRRYQPRGAQAEAMSSHGSSKADLPGVEFFQLLHRVVK